LFIQVIAVAVLYTWTYNGTEAAGCWPSRRLNLKQAVQPHDAFFAVTDRVSDPIDLAAEAPIVESEPPQR
jgi:hypothetical protein